MTKASGKASARAENPIGTRQRSSRGDASNSGEDRIVGAGVGVSRSGGAGSTDRIRDTIRDNAEGTGLQEIIPGALRVAAMARTTHLPVVVLVRRFDCRQGRRGRPR